MKKIALLHYAYPPNIGGVEMLIAGQAEILAGLGFDTTVVTGSGKEENSRVKFREIKELQSVLRFNPALQKKIVEEGIIDEEFRELAHLIGQKIEPVLLDREVIIVHNMLTLVHNLPFIYAFKEFCKKNPGKKVIIWAHDQTFVNEGKILAEKVGVNLNTEEKNLLIQPINRATYVVISETFKKLFLQTMNLSKEEIFVIPDGINVKRFLEIDDSIWQVVKRKNLLEAFPVVLSPVNILPRKNIETCLEIIAYLKKHYPKVVYIISGKPSIHRKTSGYLQMLKDKISDLKLTDNIIFLSEFFNRALKDSELHDLYDIADFVLYLSKSENFGIPILESYMAKTPIFVSNLPVFREIGGNLNYIDSNESVYPSGIYTDSNQSIRSIKQAGEKLVSFIKTNKIIEMNRLVRTKYNLEMIIKGKLLPLFL